MARKRKGSFWASTFAILDRGPANDFVEAIEFAAIHELVNLGYDDDVIETWVPYGRYPSEKWLQKKIDELESINPDALEPLSPKSYQRCFGILSEMYNLREFKEELVEEPEIGRPVDEYFNAAFEIGLVAHLIGVELVDEIALRESQSNRAKKRMGIQTSLPRSAVAYAIAQGYDTGSRVRSYFEDEPDLEPIELTLKLSKDRFGQVESYEFFDSVTGTESVPLSVESLAVTVAQVKKEPKYKDRFINRIR